MKTPDELKILHITPHMGGGVGRVISGISASDGASHSIVLLEEPTSLHFVNAAMDSGAAVFIKPCHAELVRKVDEADVVIAHWWHNPNLAKFLAHFPPSPARLVIWSHISNLTVPALSPGFLNQASMVWFTTPASYSAEIFSGLQQDMLMEKSAIVYGCAGLDDFPDLPRQAHNGFNIGYLGLLDHSKLHPDYVAFCKAVNISSAHFILAGDGGSHDKLKDLMHRHIPESAVTFHGYIKDVPTLLSSFDVFGYPLMPHHTCTTENVILEAMALRVPPVLLDQLTERYIIKDGETGLLVSGPEEYGKAMRYLFENPEERLKMGERARSHVIEKYSRVRMQECFYSAIERVMAQPKRCMDFSECTGKTPSDWFVSCLGRDRSCFSSSLCAGLSGQTSEMMEMILGCSPLLRGENKGSVFQYARAFRDDNMLTAWADIMKEASYAKRN
ncbi:MAG: glycosyl transferase family 1 [Lentisphaerae bacterium GWF2_45_14]|nr:MAG: glycosyl transferase family 1 [Lentisphaerae bacterium GWF2_45_14]